jgi:large subunit ribosomal protein L25
MLKLSLEKRDGGAQEARSKGFIPGVFYGPKAEATSVSILEAEFMKVWRKAGESSVITLTGIGEDHDALIHDVSTDAVTDKVIHVDFYVIEKGKKVEVSVPLEFVGEAPAVKTLGGSLIKVMHELEIEAMPKDLPHAIEVDISALVDFESQIKVADIKLPSGVIAKADAEEVVALAQPAKEETEEEVAGSIDMSAIEISDQKGKKEEEEIPAE